MMIGGLVSALDFSFIDLSVLPENSAGARAFYTIWIVLTYLVFPGIYSCFAPCTMQTFGPKHYSANYGLVFSMNVSKGQKRKFLTFNDYVVYISDCIFSFTFAVHADCF